MPKQSKFRILCAKKYTGLKKAGGGGGDQYALWLKHILWWFFLFLYLYFFVFCISIFYSHILMWWFSLHLYFALYMFSFHIPIWWYSLHLYFVFYMFSFYYPIWWFSLFLYLPARSQPHLFLWLLSNQPHLHLHLLLKLVFSLVFVSIFGLHLYQFIGLYLHMGQFLQGGKNGRLISFFLKSRASLWPNLMR